MRKLSVAIVGFGQLGQACAAAIREARDVDLAGVVGRPGTGGRLPAPFAAMARVEHVREVGRVDVVLLCVPAGDSQAIAAELLQQGFDVVECARIEPDRCDARHRALAELAHRKRSRIVTGAGWDPGVFTLIQGAFEMLIPRGQTGLTHRPAASLHHTLAAQGIAGVAGALAVEHAGADGLPRRYLYVELARGARPDPVRAELAADLAFAGEATEVLFVDSIAALEQESHGVVLERLGTAAGGAHQSLLLESRGDPAVLAARVMIDAARRLPELAPGGHRFSL